MDSRLTTSKANLVSSKVIWLPSTRTGTSGLALNRSATLSPNFVMTGSSAKRVGPWAVSRSPSEAVKELPSSSSSWELALEELSASSPPAPNDDAAWTQARLGFLGGASEERVSASASAVAPDAPLTSPTRLRFSGEPSEERESASAVAEDAPGTSAAPPGLRCFVELPPEWEPASAPAVIEYAPGTSPALLVCSCVAVSAAASACSVGASCIFPCPPLVIIVVVSPTAVVPNRLSSRFSWEVV
mmetsp:Transcript_4297/g.10278  ORF Transcript_4297/g.10278 Transcript_4297/m.10278 type:complete len:244 (-) Transcript_4297:29-760(-)